MYDILGYEEALYVPPSGDFLVVVVCVVELFVMLVLVYSITLMGSVYLTLVVCLLEHGSSFLTSSVY